MRAELRTVHVLSMAFSLCLAGCASWSRTNVDGSVTTHVIGYAQIRYPPAWCLGQPPEVSDVAQIGVALEPGGLLLGYGARTLIRFPPSERGYLFIDVRSQQDIDRLLAVLQQEEMKGYPVCLTINAFGNSRESSGTR